MSDMEKTAPEQTSAENNEAEQPAPEKKKRRFTIQSPYADYAADNDMCSEMMEKNEPEEKPDRKQLLKTGLTALFTVLMFYLGTLACVSIFSCVGVK